jgi:hypothetical protein
MLADLPLLLARQRPRHDGTRVHVASCFREIAEDERAMKVDAEKVRAETFLSRSAIAPV